MIAKHLEDLSCSDLRLQIWYGCTWRQFLGERSGKPDMISLDKNLAAVFGVPETDAEAGGKKKKKKKDGELPQIPKWQLAAMMDSKVDAMLTAVFKTHTVGTPGPDAPAEGTGPEEIALPSGIDLQQFIDPRTDIAWVTHGLELEAKGCAPLADTGSKQDIEEVSGEQEEKPIAPLAYFPTTRPSPRSVATVITGNALVLPSILLWINSATHSSVR